MRNSKLLDIWRCLTPKQFKRLGKFISSEYFNNNEELVSLYHYLAKFATTFDDAKGLDREEVYKAVFDKYAFDYKKLAYCMNYLMQLTEKFIAVEAIGDNYQELENHLKLLRFYQKQNLEKHFTKTLKKVESLLEKYPHLDAERYFYQYRLNEIANLGFRQTFKRTYDDRILQLLEGLDVYYLSKKLQYSCEVMTRENVITSAYNIYLLDEILDFLEQSPYNNHPCIQVYYQILKMLQKDEAEEHFLLLLNFLENFNDEFPKSEARLIYLFTINYTVRKLNEGNQEYEKYLFNLYKSLLEKEIIFDDMGHISPWTYKNINAIAIRNQAFDWALAFLEKYKNKLESSFRENAYTYNMAYYNFGIKDFQKAILQIQQVKFSDVYYSLDCKFLLARIYFELQEKDLLESHIHAFKIYLKRNKQLTQQMKTIYTHLINLLNQIFKANQQKKLEEIKKELEAMKIAGHRAWFLEKIEEKLARLNQRDPA